MVLMSLFTGQQWRPRHRKQTYGHSGEGEEGTKGESSLETYALPYIRQRAGGNLLHDSGSPTGAL